MPARCRGVRRHQRPRGCPLIRRAEAVRPVPGEVDPAEGRHVDLGVEVLELSGPAGERDGAGAGGEIEHDVSVGGVVAGPIDDEVAVQLARGRIAGRRCIDDLRADLDRGDVRGRDRAEVTGVAHVL